MSESLRLFLFSASDEITHYVMQFASDLGHKIVDYSPIYQSCLPDIIDAKPDVIICASYIHDINTAALVQILNSQKELSDCAVVVVQYSHERYMITRYTAFIPFEIFSFERMLYAAIEEKRSNKKLVYFLPEEKRLRQRITNLLHKLAMSSDLDGYRFTHRALMIIMNDGNAVRNLSKNVYSVITKEFDVTEDNVERMISTAIMASWSKCPIPIQQEIFGNTVESCPSNKVYIATLAEYLYNGSDEPLPEETIRYSNYIY